MQEVPYAVSVLRAGIEQHLDVPAVGELHGRTGRIQRELVQDIPGELSIVGGEDGLQIVDVGELATVGELAAGIDLSCEREGKVVAGGVDPGDGLPFAGAAIPRAPGPKEVEVVAPGDRTWRGNSRGSCFSCAGRCVRGWFSRRECPAPQQAPPVVAAVRADR